MTPETARNLFAAALNDTLSLTEALDFQSALEKHPVLEVEFERFAESELSETVEDITPRLAQLSGVTPPMTDALEERIRQSTRPALRSISAVRLWGSVVAAAAAFVVAVLIAWPRPSVDAPGHPALIHTGELAVTFSGGASLNQSDGVAPYLLDGTAEVSVPTGRTYTIRAPGQAIHAIGPASFRIEVAAIVSDRLLAVSDRDTALKQFGASRVTLRLTVSSGSVEVLTPSGVATVEPGASSEFTGVEEEARIRARFDALDRSGDGRLDQTELSPAVLKVMAQSGEKSAKYKGFRSAVIGLGHAESEGNNQHGHNHNHQNGNQTNDEDSAEEDDEDNESGNQD